jgi:hypothetical protein
VGDFEEGKIQLIVQITDLEIKIVNKNNDIMIMIIN